MHANMACTLFSVTLKEYGRFKAGIFQVLSRDSNYGNKMQFCKLFMHCIDYIICKPIDSPILFVNFFYRSLEK